jgi:hypothetical protein
VTQSFRQPNIDNPGDDIVASLRAATSCRPVQAADLADRAGCGGTKSQPLHWTAGLMSVNRSFRPPNFNTISGSGDDITAHEDGICERSRALLSLLDGRESRLSENRAAGAAVTELLHLLSFTRRQALDSAGRLWRSRFQPSAGGTHCIEPLLHVHNALDWPAGWFRQVGPGLNDVEEVDVPMEEALIRRVMDALHRDAPPSATIYAVAEPDILLARYPNSASLLWRDSGAFLTTAQLAATALNLSASIAGIASELDGHGRRIPAFVVGAVGLGGSDAS